MHTCMHAGVQTYIQTDKYIYIYTLIGRIKAPTSTLRTFHKYTYIISFYHIPLSHFKIYLESQKMGQPKHCQAKINKTRGFTLLDFKVHYGARITKRSQDQHRNKHVDQQGRRYSMSTGCYRGLSQCSSGAMATWVSCSFHSAKSFPFFKALKMLHTSVKRHLVVSICCYISQDSQRAKLNENRIYKQMMKLHYDSIF